MRLEQLRYFIHVVDCRSFSKAANDMFITQPALSAAIKTLENELNQPLLMRSKKGLVVTALGQKIYEDSKKLLARFQELVDGWKREAHAVEPAGVVRVLAIPTICAYLAENFLSAFAKNYQNVKILLEEAGYIDFSSSLHGKMARISITAIPLSDEKQQVANWKAMGYEPVPLMEDSYAIVMGANHPLSSKQILLLNDCLDLNFCAYSGEAEVPSTPLNSFLRSFGENKKQPEVFLNNRETITRMLMSNHYASLLLKKMMSHTWAVRDGILVIKNYEQPVLPSRHYLICLPEYLLAPAETCFREFVLSHYALQYN